jgi:hypothetical protein
MQLPHTLVVQVLVPVNVPTAIGVREFESEIGRLDVVLRHLQAELFDELVLPYAQELFPRYSVVFKLTKNTFLNKKTIDYRKKNVD